MVKKEITNKYFCAILDSMSLDGNSDRWWSFFMWGGLDKFVKHRRSMWKDIDIFKCMVVLDSNKKISYHHYAGIGAPIKRKIT